MDETTWCNYKVTSNGIFMRGLVKRRKLEYALFIK